MQPTFLISFFKFLYNIFLLNVELEYIYMQECSQLGTSLQMVTIAN